MAPAINFAPLDNALTALRESAGRYDAALSASGGTARDPVGVNALLIRVERAFASPDGLPRREWYKHLLYAPGFYTGYGVKTMPQIREGLEENRFTEAQGGVRTVSAAINALAAQVRDAAQALQSATK